MSRILFTAAAALAAATPAMAEEVSFTRDGVTYVYAVESKDNVRTIKGSTSDGSRFEFKVRNGWVRGDIDGTPISFAAPKETTPSVTIAKR